MALTDAQLSDALAGLLGPVHYAPRYHLRTVENGILDDLTVAFRQGQVTLNNFQDGAMRVLEAQLEPSLVTALNPLTDVISASIEVGANVAGVAETRLIQVGLFIMDNPEKVITPLGETWQIRALDLSVLLLQNTPGTPYRVAAGTRYSTAVETILDLLGLRHSIGEVGDVTPFDLTWGPDVAFANIINDLLRGINFYSLYPTATGVFTTTGRVDLITQPAAQVYASGDGLVLQEWRQRISPRLESNEVVVLRDHPLGVAFFSKVTNSDGDSLNSTATLGVVNRASVISIDALVDQAMATVVATQEVRDRAMRSQAADFQSVPDPRRGAHETYQVTIEGGPQTETWAVDTWQMSLDGTSMTHGLLKPESLDAIEVITTDDVV